MVSIQSPARVRSFVDSSVLFSASISATSSARDLITAGIAGVLPVHLSDFVLSETEENLANKAPQALARFSRFCDALRGSLVNPPTTLVRQVAEWIEPKDAAIVAGVIHAQATHLATYDRRHLLSKRDLVREAFGLEVATPDDILVTAGFRRTE